LKPTRKEGAFFKDLANAQVYSTQYHQLLCSQLYQQTSNKKHFCTSDPILEKAKNIFHTHVKKKVVLIEYTALMKGQSCTSLN